MSFLLHTSGSVRGATRKGGPYRDTELRSIIAYGVPGTSRIT